MWVGWDLTVFQSFFKASREKSSLQAMFFESSRGDELGTVCFGGTSCPRDPSVRGSWRPIPPNLLHACAVLR